MRQRVRSQKLLRSPTKAPTSEVDLGDPATRNTLEPAPAVHRGGGDQRSSITRAHPRHDATLASERGTILGDACIGLDARHNARLDLWWRASVGIGHRRRATARPPHRTKHRQQGRRGCELVHEATEQVKRLRESRGEAHARHRCSLVRANCMPPRCCRRAVESDEEGVPRHPSDHVLLSLGGKGACS